MPAEWTHQIGRDGTATLKRWLEATTYLELPFDAYHHDIDCYVSTLTGGKRLDLAGNYVTGNRNPVFVESKRYSSAGRQYKEFKEFLAIAYSSTAKEVSIHGRHRSPHFLWVTFHPFNLDKWSSLETFPHMKAAVVEHASEHISEDHDIDDELIVNVASRVTVLLFNPKQEALSLTRTELEVIRPSLERKARTL